jgi:Acetyltransferase (GNAT) domain
VESKLRVFELDFRKDTRWEQFACAHPDALIFHHPGWLAALESEYDQKCVSLACADDSERLMAILPLFYTRGLRLAMSPVAAGRRLSSLPRTPIAGPLALSTNAETRIIEHAIELARSQRVQLEIKTRTAGLENSLQALSCVPWRPTYVEELPSHQETDTWQDFWENLRQPRACASCDGCRRLRFGNAKRQHRVSWAVRKAIKLGLTIRQAETEEDLQRWYRLYLLTMRHNAVPPRPYRLFQTLWSQLRRAGKVRLLIAEQERRGLKRMVAGSILLEFGQTVFYAFTGCAPEDFSLHPHDILQIESIRGACRRGFRWYDFGEVAEEHETLTRFKTKWGGIPQPLYRYYSGPPVKRTADNSSQLAVVTRGIWRRLPTKATSVLGDLIYRRM